MFDCQVFPSVVILLGSSSFAQSSSSPSSSNQTLLSSSEPKCVWKEPRECGAADRHPLFFSSCSKNTEWNYFGVAKELKKWVRSVRVDPEEMPPDIAVAFHDESEEEEGEDGEKSPHLDFVGRVNSRGFAVGNFWTSMGYSDSSPFNHGFLYGPLDERGEMSGEAVAFVYPDMRTALAGRFRGNVMKRARATKVVAERCLGGIKQIRVAKPKKDAPFYKYFAATEVRVAGDQPTLVDPYETRFIYVGNVPGVGEGVFAKKDIKKGVAFTYYAGYAYNVTDRPIYAGNLTATDYERIHKNVITLTDDIWMNLPYELWYLDKFRSSLAHKLNHSFRKANCQFISVYNPRFGLIRGAEATRDILAGEQIFVEYGYPIEDLYPPWYVDLYLQEMGPLPKEARAKLSTGEEEEDESSSSRSSKSSSTVDLFADEEEVERERKRAIRAKEMKKKMRNMKKNKGGAKTTE